VVDWECLDHRVLIGLPVVVEVDLVLVWDLGMVGLDQRLALVHMLVGEMEVLVLQLQQVVQDLPIPVVVVVELDITLEVPQKLVATVVPVLSSLHILHK
jgi:hypothetical protein